MAHLVIKDLDKQFNHGHAAHNYLHLSIIALFQLYFWKKQNVSASSKLLPDDFNKWLLMFSLTSVIG